MKVVSVSLALLLSLAAPVAFAGDHGDHGDKKMSCPMHDPSATAEDRARHLDEMFAKLDADKDGAISRAEFEQHHADMRSKHEAHAQDGAAPAADEHAAHQ